MSTNAKGPFRADHVGSLLRPAKLQQARMQHERKNVTAQRLREIEDESIREVVKLQEDVGLEGITDGELRRDYWHLDFLTNIGGVVFEDGRNPLKWHRQDGMILLQSSDCGCNGIRVMTQRGLQITGPYKFGD